MSQAILSVENLSKKFCRNLRRSLWYGVKDLTREMLLRRNGGADLRRDEFWALRDISLELSQGETLGLIGHNGAGKSTLLKLINGLIKPDTGCIRVWGHVGALIELGTGFNPILTGRENIYVNAAVLGLPRREVDRRLDEIIDFAEIGDFIDAPVQSYSSGMTVRLGFSIAAHLNPDLLLIDEILSVGDASFRQRCISRLGNYKRNGGTVIFVSHNSGAVEAISDRVMLLDHGQVKALGRPSEVVEMYERWSIGVSRQATFRLSTKEKADLIDEIWFTDVQCYEMAGKQKSEFEFGESFAVRFYYETNADIQSPYFTIAIRKGYGEGPIVSAVHMLWNEISMDGLPRKGVIECVLESPSFSPGIYTIEAGVLSKSAAALGKKWYAAPRNCGTFTVLPNRFRGLFPGVPAADLYASGFPLVIVPHYWKLDGHILSHNPMRR